MKRLLAMLLLFAMVLGLLPAGIAAEKMTGTQSRILTEEDYALADLMWDEINEQEEQMLAKRAPTSQTTEALIDTVTASPYYEEGSLNRNGASFFWKTVDGIACGYFPRMSAVAREAQMITEAETATTLTYNYGTRSPSSKDVYVMQPYYGLDADFTTQYVTEAQNIAKATGGAATVYRTTDATIDNIANALEQGAVVIFDSHGDTDYVNPKNENDCTSRANTSYICLQDGTGITSADMVEVQGPYSKYYHAVYGGYYGQMKFYYVDGTAIANHMDRSAPNSLLWAALCLGMATNGLHKPLMDKGVAVAYGYSQSVTFDYDYAWEEVFWKQMTLGKTVAEAIAMMKEEVGCWDWCHHYQYDTLAEARSTYSAFPIVVSAEDAYPGHGNVDNLQTVHSTWTLCAECNHAVAQYYPAKPATCTESGVIPHYYCNECECSFADEACTQMIAGSTVIEAPGHNYELTYSVEPQCNWTGVNLYTCARCGDTKTETLPATGHSFDSGVITTAPTCTEIGVRTYNCTSCGARKMESIPATGHSFDNGTVTTAATCTEVGIRTYVCSGCEIIRTEEIPATGHSFDGGKVTTAATCTEVGIRTYTCGGCGCTKTEEIPAKGHLYILYSNAGPNHNVMCAYCRNVYAESHDYSSGSCVCGATEPTVDSSIKIGHTLNLTSDIAINYVVKATTLESYDSYYMVCTLPVYEGNTLTGTKTLTLEPELREGYYYFVLNGLISLEMNNMVDAQLYMFKDGATYASEVDRYSIATYAYIASTSAAASQNLQTLTERMVIFGDSALAHFG